MIIRRQKPALAWSKVYSNDDFLDTPFLSVKKHRDKKSLEDVLFMIKVFLLTESCAIAPNGSYVYYRT